MATLAAQMNVRMDRDTKERGDQALAAAGFTPSDAVRKVWEFAAANACEPQAIRDALAFSSVHDASQEGENENPWARGAGLVGGYYRSVGIDAAALSQVAEPYCELRDRMYEELLSESEAR